MSRVKTIHGGSSRKEYGAWVKMRHRCYSPKSARYENYGGRGITVCERWRDSFPNFSADMGPRPSPQHSLDRIDVNGHYTPENCRWATFAEQMRNRTNSLVYHFEGRERPLAEIAELLGVPIRRLYSRLLKHKMPPEKAFRSGKINSLGTFNFRGEQRTVPEIAKLLGMKYQTLIRRISVVGMPPEIAFQPGRVVWKR